MSKADKYFLWSWGSPKQTLYWIEPYQREGESVYRTWQWGGGKWAAVVGMFAKIQYTCGDQESRQVTKKEAQRFIREETMNQADLDSHWNLDSAAAARSIHDDLAERVSEVNSKLVGETLTAELLAQHAKTLGNILAQFAHSGYLTKYSVEPSTGKITIFTDHPHLMKYLKERRKGRDNA